MFEIKTLPEYTQQGFIQLYEYIVAIIYLVLIYSFAIVIRNKFYKKSPLKKYLFPALTVKLIGGLGVCLIYNYYYHSGDTCNYFFASKVISTIIFNNPSDGIRLFFSSGGNFAPDLIHYIYDVDQTGNESSYIVVRIATIINVFTLRSFLVTSMLFGFFSFWAVWKLFEVFCRYYPTLHKQFAFAILFVPSVFFWGSGILKDTVCFASLCLFFHCIDSFFMRGKNKLLSGFGMLLTGYILTVVKVYIMMSFSVCILLLMFLHYRSKIKSRTLRLFITPIISFFAIIAGSTLILFITSGSSKYSLDKIVETAEVTREYIYYSGGGSSYSLGEIDNSIWGLIKVFPAGVNVTLFRPYLWEAHNIIAFISSIESFIILIITFLTIRKTGFLNFFKVAASNNLAFFCLTFSIMFAYFVGISSYNFGTLVRYKIPCIPFYIVAIQIISHLATQNKIRLKKRMEAALNY